MFSRPSESLTIRARCAVEPGLQVGLRAVGNGMHVARRQEVGAVVVGEEDLAGVEAGRRGEGPPARRALVVRDLRRVVLVEREEVEPAGVAADRGEQDHLLELGDRRRIVPRGEGERPVGDRGALGEAARAPPVDRLDQREVHRLHQARRHVGEAVEHGPAPGAQGLGPGLEAEARQQGAGADERGADQPAAGGIEHRGLLGEVVRGEGRSGPGPGAATSCHAARQHRPAAGHRAARRGAPSRRGAAGGARPGKRASSALSRRRGGRKA